MRATAVLVVAVAACKSSTPSLSAEDRKNAMTAAKQCTDADASLAPSYQMVGPKLAHALKMDRTEAQRLMRDSIELLISTREMLCNVSMPIVDGVLAKSPKDEQIVAAKGRMTAALAHLAEVRAAYDKLLGAASSADVPVDQDALLERFSKALVGP